MILSRLHRSLSIALVAAVAAAAPLSAADAPDRDAPPRHASIHVDGKVPRANLPALAKISFAEALDIAARAQPGRVIKGELEVEGGVLMYSFDVVTRDRTVKEVEIDAGTGTVLDVDSD
ncbi:peptidase propeptide and YPEB domain protein [mine drainage metagenome]|uniref:Peptidase propeptide and YPEB domain protein n=1 Tax=mine drainage metagenome TaxID=410659 RepID=A0A1J5S1N1_9ZZZZ